jgi:hypothetical protein
MPYLPVTTSPSSGEPRSGTARQLIFLTLLISALFILGLGVFFGAIKNAERKEKEIDSMIAGDAPHDVVAAVNVSDLRFLAIYTFKYKAEDKQELTIPGIEDRHAILIDKEKYRELPWTKGLVIGDEQERRYRRTEDFARKYNQALAEKLKR